MHTCGASVRSHSALIVSTSVHVVVLEHHVVIYVGHGKGNSPLAAISFVLRTSAIISSVTPFQRLIMRVHLITFSEM